MTFLLLSDKTVNLYFIIFFSFVVFLLLFSLQLMMKYDEDSQAQNYIIDKDLCLLLLENPISTNKVTNTGLSQTQRIPKITGNCV